MIWDTRGTELGWLVAQVIPALLVREKHGDVIICDWDMKEFFGLAGIRKSMVTDGRKIKNHTPDMLGPFLRRKFKIIEQDGVPVIDAEKKAWNLRLPEKRDRISIHARMIDRHTKRNWSKEKWNSLCKMLPKQPRAIGTISDYVPEGSICMRGPGWIVANVMHSMVVIGGSSGPIHLAQMLGIPVITWSGNAFKDRPRYEKVWNLKNSPVEFASESWDPEVEEVLDAFYRLG